ncbi:Alkaline ceramidase 3 [Rhizophlyctis rosea]|nr:Alkaline ceramidase 3 [Rhizophlyctis rosea]
MMGVVGTGEICLANHKLDWVIAVRVYQPGQAHGRTGSFAFHGTLTYEMQLADELPMIYGTCILVFCTLQMFPPHKFVRSMIITLIFYSIFVTAVYVHLRDPVFHQVSYAILVAITALVPIAHMRRLSKLVPGVGRTLVTLYVVSLGSYLFGFLLWNIENFHCDTFRAWRERVGYPWRVVAELHAWWHVLTAYGTYGSIILCQYMRALALKRKDVEVQVFGILPVLGLKEEVKKQKKKL